jgi:hypothetical protein
VFIAFASTASDGQSRSLVMRAGHIRHVSAAICAGHHGECPRAVEN